MAETADSAAQPAGGRAHRLSLSAIPRLRLAVNPYVALFWSYIFVALVLFTFLVPPFQKSDEVSHYYRAISLTNLDLTCKKGFDGKDYFAMKAKYIEFPNFMHVWDVAFMYNAKFNTDWLRSADYSNPALQAEGRVYDICNLSPLGYAPNVAGVLAGKPFHDPIVGFFFGRVLGAVFFCAAIALSLRVAPERYRPLVYLYAGLPTVLHQVGAISYDAVHLSLWPLIFAYLAKFLTQPEPVRRGEFVVFLGLLWWSVNVRMLAYVPLALLVLAIPPSRLGGRSAYLRTTGAFFAFTAVTTAGLSLLYLGGSTFLAPDAVGISASSQLRFVLEHPWHFFAASYRTLQFWGELLLRQGIGVFGWIDYSFNFVPYYALVLLGGVLAYYIAQRDVLVLRPPQLGALWLAIIGNVVALFVTLYAVWSPVGAGVVGGLQGRYFIGLLPFGVLAVSQTAQLVGRRRSAAFAILALGLFVLASIYRAIMQRYY